MHQLILNSQHRLHHSSNNLDYYRIQRYDHLSLPYCLKTLAYQALFVEIGTHDSRKGLSNNEAVFEIVKSRPEKITNL